MTRTLLLASLKASRKRIEMHPALIRLSGGGLDRQDWQTFISERFCAAGRFVPLLAAGIVAALKNGEMRLGLVLAQNLRDELGYDATNRYRPALAHATWRDWLTAAVGAQVPTQPLPGTVTYTACLDELIESQSCFAIAGAILALEFSIPAEFRRIRMGLEMDFPKHFRIEATDSLSRQRRKERARRYLVDHEEHDRRSHYPDLLAVLVAQERNTGTTHKGIATITEARCAFYDGFGKT